MSKRQDRRVKRRTLHALPDRTNDPIARGVGVVTVSFSAQIPDEAVCHYCGLTKSPMTRDHVVPKGERGTDAWWNLVPSCEPCNRHKGNAMPTCHCAFCNRAVFLFELGHLRPEGSPRAVYREPQPQRPRKKRPNRQGNVFKIKAPPLPKDVSDPSQWLPPSFPGST